MRTAEGDEVGSAFAAVEGEVFCQEVERNRAGGPKIVSQVDGLPEAAQEAAG